MQQQRLCRLDEPGSRPVVRSRRARSLEEEDGNNDPTSDASEATATPIHHRRRCAHGLPPEFGW
jgi:hypothetical protein